MSPCSMLCNVNFYIKVAEFTYLGVYWSMAKMHYKMNFIFAIDGGRSTLMDNERHSEPLFKSFQRILSI